MDTYGRLWPRTVPVRMSECPGRTGRIVLRQRVREGGAAAGGLARGVRDDRLPGPAADGQLVPEGPAVVSRPDDRRRTGVLERQPDVFAVAESGAPEGLGRTVWHLTVAG